MSAGSPPSIERGSIVRGPTLPEPVEVLAIVPFGASLKVIGRGLNTGLTHDPVLTPDQLRQLTVSADREPSDGDARLFRLGIEAQRLGLAYVYDPFLSLSIARVDPLPHQLEAVYEYVLRLPRIRFLLADDPGAGNTIMAGLLLKELKARGLVRRVLIVAPANLTFQWQREMADKPGAVRRDPRCRLAGELRPELLAGIQPVHHVGLLGRHHGRRAGEPAAVPLGPQDERLFRGPQDLQLPPRRVALQHDRPLLLMTATPQKGDAEHFRRLLALLDPDVYGNIESLRRAMDEHEVPFYLQRTKEALVTFPSPVDGHVCKLFTNREVRTAAFDLDGDELNFYDELAA